MSKIDDIQIDYRNGERSSWDSHLAETLRQNAQFTAPAEGELLQHGFTQLPTAAAKLRPLGARCTSPRRAVIGQRVGGYFVPEVIFLFNPNATGPAEQLRTITPDGDAHVGEHAALFSAADVALMVAESGRYRWPGPAPFHIDELDARLAGETSRAGATVREAHADGRLFTATTPDGMVQMVQVRRDPATEDEDAGSAGKYLSLHHTDAGWLFGEPEGPLSFAGGSRLKDAAGRVVFVHEGISTPPRLYAEIAKVRACEPSALLDSHPLREHVLTGVHVGYLGGAHWPQRADWRVIRSCGAAKVVIVPDNDDAGRGAVSRISRALAGMTCTWLQFTSEFVVGQDMADPWPGEMFIVNDDGARVYRVDAPTFEDMEHPASWLTRRTGVTGGRNPRPVFDLHPGASEMWTFVAEMGEYYDTANPRRKGAKAETLNRLLSRFSDVKDTVTLLDSARSREVAALTYRPDRPSGMVHDDGQAKFNQYVAPRYGLAEPGADVSIWLRFLEHLLPQEKDLRQVMRWLATLVARPSVRMGYGLLLQSTETGTGKSTFAEIASRLVGRPNASAPLSKMVVDADFNGWLINKRLVTVHEIYEGGNWKAANKLKSLVTERHIEVNEKFKATYTAPLYTHFICCSNHTVSLMIDNKDRRWLIPEVAEVKLPEEFAREFYRWLDGPGLGGIAQWAQDFGDYVRDGEEAPMTERKKEQIRDSLSKAQQFALDVFARMTAISGGDGRRTPFVVGAHEVLDAAKLIWGDEVKDKPADIMSIANNQPGVVVASNRVRHGPKASTPLTYSIRNDEYGKDTEFRADYLFDLKQVVSEYQSGKQM